MGTEAEVLTKTNAGSVSAEGFAADTATRAGTDPGRA